MRNAGAVPRNGIVAEVRSCGWYWLKLPSGDEKLACSHGCFLLLATEEHEAVTKRLNKVKVTRADNAERFKKAVRA